MALAIFDLDNTLIGGDSDHLWGEFVCARGLVDSAAFSALNDQFYADYQSGNLDIDAYLRHALSPIATALGIEDLLACEAEIENGLYTGEPTGTPSYKEGKVTRLEEWLRGRDISLEGAYFYSDSHNDLPLLEQIDKPIAVDPDDTLLARAQEAGWPVISLRG